MIQILNGETNEIELQYEWPSLQVTVGTPGVAGLSAYQIALLNGFVGTEAEWLASLIGVADLPPLRILGNLSGVTAPAGPLDDDQVRVWLDVPTNFAFGALSATVIGLAGDVVDLETDKIDASNNDYTPSSNIFTIGTSTASQRIRLRRRFASAGDFSQLSIDFSGDNCRIQTQQAGNNANPIVFGTSSTDRVFIHGTNSWMGIGGMPTTRPLEILASTAAFRLQSSSAVSPPVYTEVARTFDFVTWQDSTSPFNTSTDLVANSNQFNNHSIRIFVHTSGTSAPVLSTTFNANGSVSMTGALTAGGSISCNGTVTFNDTPIVRRAANVLAQINGTNGQIAQWFNTFISATNLRAFQVDVTDTTNVRIGSIVGSLGGTNMGIHLGRTNNAGVWATWFGVNESSYTISNPGALRAAIDVADEASSIYYALALGGV